MLDQMKKTIHYSPDLTKVALNKSYIYTIELSYLPLHDNAVEIAMAVGPVEVRRGNKSCILLAAEKIQKSVDREMLVLNANMYGVRRDRSLSRYTSGSISSRLSHGTHEFKWMIIRKESGRWCKPMRIDGELFYALPQPSVSRCSTQSSGNVFVSMPIIPVHYHALPASKSSCLSRITLEDMVLFVDSRDLKRITGAEMSIISVRC